MKEQLIKLCDVSSTMQAEYGITPSRSTVRRWIDQGYLTTLKLGGGVYTSMQRIEAMLVEQEPKKAAKAEPKSSKKAKAKAAAAEFLSAEL